MTQLSDFKALLFDIDRTLIPPSREIFPEVVMMLNQLHAAGFMIGLCSGRGFASIKNKLIPLFPENSIHILAGGSLVISNTGKVLWEQTINSQSVSEIKKLISQTDSVAIFMKPDAQYSQSALLKKIQAHPWNQIGKNLTEMKLDGVGLIYIPNPTQEIEKYIKNNSNLTYKDMVSSNGHRYFDITAAGVNKAKALEKWSTYTQIPTNKVIGFGDSINDLEFLQSVGFAVAMGNADEIIKNTANRTIGSVDENGLATYLQGILKGESL